MDSTMSQESDIINPGDYDAIIGDLAGTYPAPSLSRIMDVSDATQQSDVSVTIIDVIPPVEVPAEPDGNGLSHIDSIRGPTGTSPSIEDYPGPYNFKIQLSPSNRCAWTYSERLRKVFIDMEKVLLIKFSVTPSTEGICQSLRVRALLMFTTPDNMSDPVERCFTHWGRSDSRHEAHTPEENVCRCSKYNLVGHVLTTDNERAIYEYNELSKRHSVMVPVDPVSPEYGDTVVAYKFGCKTSCRAGMDRRPARIIFTLETPSGVVGRCSLLFKVCSCPKRDKDREESDEFKDLPALATASGKVPLYFQQVTDEHPTKKIKLTPQEELFIMQRPPPPGNLPPLQQNQDLQQNFLEPQPFHYEQQIYNESARQCVSCRGNNEVTLARLESKIDEVFAQNVQINERLNGLSNRLEQFFQQISWG